MLNPDGQGIKHIRQRTCQRHVPTMWLRFPVIKNLPAHPKSESRPDKTEKAPTSFLSTTLRQISTSYIYTSTTYRQLSKGCKQKNIAAIYLYIAGRRILQTDKNRRISAHAVPGTANHSLLITKPLAGQCRGLPLGIPRAGGEVLLAAQLHSGLGSVHGRLVAYRQEVLRHGITSADAHHLYRRAHICLFHFFRNHIIQENICTYKKRTLPQLGNVRHLIPYLLYKERILSRPTLP